MASDKLSREALETFLLSVIPTPPDFTFRSEGSICFLRPQTDDARAWVEEFIGRDNGYQPQWPSVLLEPRYAESVLTAISEAGLSIGGE